MKLKTLQRIFLYLFFFSINFEVWDPFNTSFFSVSKLTGLFYFFSLLPHLQEFLSTTGIQSFTIPLWIFFALLSILNLLHANYVSSIFIDFSIFQNIILFILLVNHARKEPDILETAFFSFAIGSIVLSILYYLGVGISYEGGRVTLFDDNENNIGIRMCISLTILALIIIKNDLRFRKWRYLLLLAFPLMLSLMAETGSRVSFLSFSLIFVLTVILYKTKKVFGKILVFLIGTGLGVYVWNYLMSAEILSQRLLESVQDQNLAGRDVIWKSMLPIIEKNPVFGVGETGFALITQGIFGKIQSPHNVVLEILCYTGIVGLSLYLIFIYKIFKTSFQTYRSKGYLMQLLLLVPVFALLLSGQLLVTKVAWIVFAFVVSMIPLVNPNHKT